MSFIDMGHCPNIAMLALFEYSADVGKKYLANVKPIKLILYKYWFYIGNIVDDSPILCNYKLFTENISSETSILHKYWLTLEIFLIFQPLLNIFANICVAKCEYSHVGAIFHANIVPIYGKY